MSVKSKNITYESSEPAFLRRLKGQYGGNSDRQGHPLARPRKSGTRDDSDDDGPTYVHEESHDTITKEEYEKMLNTATDEGAVSKTSNTTEGEKLDSTSAALSKNASKKAVEASIGVKKRRLARAIEVPGDEQLDDHGGRPKKSAKKPEKTGRKIKLSFDE